MKFSAVILFLTTIAVLNPPHFVNANESEFYRFDDDPNVNDVLEVFRSGKVANEAVISVDTGARLDRPHKVKTSRSRNLYVANVSRPDDGGWKWMPSQIFFDLNSSQILGSRQGILDTMGKALAQDKSISIVVSGHADARGSHSVNDPLSKRRALAVRDYLVANYNIQSKRLSVRWRGEREPMPGFTPRDPENRRVQFGVRKLGADPKPKTNDESDQQAVSDLLKLLKNQQEE